MNILGGAATHLLPYVAKRAARFIRRRYFAPRVRVFKRRRFVKNVRRAIGYKPEFKYSDTTANGPLYTGGEVTLLNSVAEGTAINQRLGAGACGNYIVIDIMVTAPSNSDLTDMFRGYLIYDKSPNGTLPAFADIFTGPGSYRYNWMKKPENGDRFKIIKCIEIDTAQASTGPTVNGHQKYYYKIPEYITRSIWPSTGTGVPNTGAFYFVTVTENNTASTATSSEWRLFARYAFLDI